MIRVIRIDGTEILINTDTIEKVVGDEENRAIITLTSGETLKVKNQVYDVTTKVKAYIKGISEERKGTEKPKKDKEKKENEGKPKPRPKGFKKKSYHHKSNH